MQMNTLIAINPDLPSRMAIRYVCQLRNQIDLKMHLIHVAEAEAAETPVGTGWVHNKWEDSLLQRTRNLIDQMVKSEKQDCPILGRTQIIAGDREEYISRELSFSGYDLFVEGIFHSFSPDLFLKKVRSLIYRTMPCHILMVRNMVKLNKGVLILNEDAPSDRAAACFDALFSRSAPEPDVLVCNFDPSTVGPVETSADGVRKIRGTVEAILPYIQNTALIICRLPRENSPMETLLSRSPCPVLFYS